MIYTLQSLYFDCDYPKWMQYAGFCYGATIIALFLNFYIQTYIKRPARSKVIILFVFIIVFFNLDPICGRNCSRCPVTGQTMWISNVDAVGTCFLCLHHPVPVSELLFPCIYQISKKKGKVLFLFSFFIFYKQLNFLIIFPIYFCIVKK